MKVTDIEGIDSLYAERLHQLGIVTIEDLLVHGAMRSERRKLAEYIGIEEAKVLAWVKQTDLLRIKGIGPQYGRLLHATGVDTITELRTRNAENLYAKLIEVHAEKKITGTIPSLSQVTDYINQAIELEPVISY